MIVSARFTDGLSSRCTLTDDTFSHNTRLTALTGSIKTDYIGKCMKFNTFFTDCVRFVGAVVQKAAPNATLGAFGTSLIENIDKVAVSTIAAICSFKQDVTVLTAVSCPTQLTVTKRFVASNVTRAAKIAEPGRAALALITNKRSVAMASAIILTASTVIALFWITLITILPVPAIFALATA